MNARTLVLALVFLGSALPQLVRSAAADPVLLRTTTAGSLSDHEFDGEADSGSFYGAVTRATGVHESRGFAEFNTLPVHGRTPMRAWIAGLVEANGNTDYSRTVNVLWYRADGAFGIEDFARTANPIGSFTVPAFTWDWTFSLDVTDVLRHFLAQNGIWMGFRFEAAHDMDSVIVGGHAGDFDLTLAVDQASAVPEPATLLLAGSGIGGMLAARRRRRTARGVRP